MAYLGSEERDLKKYLVWKDTASTLAFIVGPDPGGLMYSLFGRGVMGDNTNGILFVIFFLSNGFSFASMSVMLFMKNIETNKKVLKTTTSTTNEKANESNSKKLYTTTDNDKADIKDNEESNGSKTEMLISWPHKTKLWTGVVSVACELALYHSSLLQNPFEF